MSQLGFSGTASDSMSIGGKEDHTSTSDSIEDQQSQSVYVVSNSHISTPVSILIESLIKNICMIYETDSAKANMMYKIICDKLYSMKLLGESYTMAEFEGIRSQYQRGFRQWLSSVKRGDKNLPLTPIWPSSQGNSHYHSEFDEVEYIAGGGFGQVILIYIYIYMVYRIFSLNFEYNIKIFIILLYKYFYYHLKVCLIQCTSFNNNVFFYVEFLIFVCKCSEIFRMCSVCQLSVLVQLPIFHFY